MRKQGTGGKVVLVVEDEALICFRLMDELEEADFTVLGVATADKALELLGKGEAVDAVVTDVRMPGRVDGLGLAGWMWEHRRATPVVITSGYVTKAEANAAHPAASVVPKPYDPKDIVALLANLGVAPHLC